MKDVVKNFETKGLKLDNYLQTCIKKSSMFTMSPKTIEEHINIIRFSNYNNNREFDNQTFWEQILKTPIQLTYSSGLLLTERLIIPKMFENQKIPQELKGRHLKQKLELKKLPTSPRREKFF